MEMNQAIESFIELSEYCKSQAFKGWDPYDGLNSRVFQAIPFASRSSLMRLIVIQGFKRSPINLRRLAWVSKEYNPKGVALCLHAYANIAELLKAKPQLQAILGSADEAMEQCDDLARILLSLRSQGEYHGACWGYNFDWQARKLFLFPKFTPTVVATTFAAEALLKAAQVTGNLEYQNVALSASEFVINDLHRTPFADGFLFSYSPLPGNDTVFNASLLGSKLLSTCFRFTGDEKCRNLAEQSAAACCAGQRSDGAWVYGMLPVQSWVDSFHTGYNLEALQHYEDNTGDKQFHEYIERGFDYYIKHFFERDGCPKYYDNKKYPIDIHCPAQLFVTLSTLKRFDQFMTLAEQVLMWTNLHMRCRKQGYYYYQLKQGFSSKISYMRWSNAFMLYALSHFIINQPQLQADDSKDMNV